MTQPSFGLVFTASGVVTEAEDVVSDDSETLEEKE